MTAMGWARAIAFLVIVGGPWLVAMWVLTRTPEPEGDED